MYNVVSYHICICKPLEDIWMLCEVLLMQICSTSVFKQTCIPLARIPAGAESNRDICYGKVMNACMCTDNYACVCLLCPRVANQVPRHFAMSNPMVVPGGMEYQTDLYRSIQIYTELQWRHGDHSVEPPVSETTTGQAGKARLNFTVVESFDRMSEASVTSWWTPWGSQF